MQDDDVTAVGEGLEQERQAGLELSLPDVPEEADRGRVERRAVARVDDRTRAGGSIDDQELDARAALSGRHDSKPTETIGAQGRELHRDGCGRLRGDRRQG
jgi:hypothetical protein